MVSSMFDPAFLEAIAKMRELPPLPIFASSNLFPSDKTIMFADGDQEFCCAHPEFWKRFPEKDLGPANLKSTAIPPICGIPVHDLDHPASVVMRERVYGAMGKIIEAAAEGLTKPKN